MTGGDWEIVLESAPLLSPVFRRRHARVLARLAAGASPALVAEARRLAIRDPRTAGRLLAGLPPRAHTGSRREVRIEGAPLPAVLRDAVERGADLEAVLSDLPRLQSCAVPLHPDRRARVVPDPAGDLVAMAWSAGSLPARRANRDRLAALARKLTAVGVPVSAPDIRTIVDVGTGDPWVLAPFHGTTAEDYLRVGPADPVVRRKLVDAVVALRQAFLDEGWVWQGFAPRNMFFADGVLVLIDFEECVDLDGDPVRAAECLLWHEVFFADSLAPDEATRVFARHPKIPEVEADRELAADPWECAVLGRSTLTWDERATLLARTARLESAQPRPDGGQLPGHALGHFWGDFLSDDVEARIFRCLDSVDNPGDLAAALEVFEAAMEADIDALLLADVTEDPMPTPARSAALAAAVGPDSVRRLIELRRSQPDWRDAAISTPASLADRVIAALALDAPDLRTAEMLVGDPGQRDQHRASLIAAVDQGLGFLHGDGRRDRFLEYAAPEHLASILGGPVPEDGSDLGSVLQEVSDRIIRYSVAQSDPGYLAFPDSGNAVAALAGAVLGPMGYRDCHTQPPTARGEVGALWHEVVVAAGR